jgi:hypothetical protein
MAAVIRSLKKTLSSSSEYIAKLSEVQEQEVHRHVAQAELMMVYSDIQVLIFSS